MSKTKMEVLTMKHNKKKLALFAVLLSTIIFTTAQAANEWAVDSKGNITLNGSVFRIKGGAWFGLEGRQELPTDATNPGGAPMEIYMGNVFWSPSSRTIAADAVEIKTLGFNCVRIPVSPQTLDDFDPQGKSPNLKNTQSVRIEGAFTALKASCQGMFRRRPLRPAGHAHLLQLRRLEEGPPGRPSAVVGCEPG